MTKVSDNYHSKVQRKAHEIHEATNWLGTDVEIIMKNLNFITRKEVNDIRYYYCKIYGDDMSDVIVDSLLFIGDLDTIERRIIPDPVSPFAYVMLGILSYAYCMYLILSQ